MAEGLSFIWDLDGTLLAGPYLREEASFLVETLKDIPALFG